MAGMATFGYRTCTAPDASDGKPVSYCSYSTTVMFLAQSLNHWNIGLLQAGKKDNSANQNGNAVIRVELLVWNVLMILEIHLVSCHINQQKPYGM